MSTQDSNIKTEVKFGDLELSRVFRGMYEKKNTETAEFKQKVTTTTTYPSITVQNSEMSNPFSMEEFDDSDAQTYDNVSTRVAWIKVPRGTTEAQVKAKLAQKPHFIRQVISNHPILTTQQKNAIESGVTTKDAIANSQIIRYPNAGVNPNEVILDRNTNKPMYKENYLALVDGELGDENRKTVEANDYYLSEELKKELSTTDVPNLTEEQPLDMAD